MPLLPPEHDVHLADIGTAFRGRAVDLDPVTGIKVVVDLTGATVFWRFERPNGTTYDRTATILVAADGTFDYITVSGDIDKVGPWKRQAHITLPGQGVWWTNKIPYNVASTLAAPV